ncbi:MAG: hypothetical protein LUE64_06150 [Candidatus Gastranaerophilales bacterium]|nr:hypothetical protein [Candidatus Gastranaerophilales bacterium]
MESVKADYPDEVVSAGQLLRILDSDAREVSALCQKACLKPKKDGFGNIYFSKGDVDVLRKVKELHEYTKKLQDEKEDFKKESSPVEPKFSIPSEETFNPAPKKESKLFKKQKSFEVSSPKFQVSNSFSSVENAQPAVIRKIEDIENNVVSRITDVLSEKLDGLDEVIVELIKAKTENETLRQKVNDLNKENFALKTENSSYKSVGFGLYVKKSSDEFTF